MFSTAEGKGGYDLDYRFLNASLTVVMTVTRKHSNGERRSETFQTLLIKKVPYSLWLLCIECCGDQSVINNIVVLKG